MKTLRTALGIGLVLIAFNISVLAQSPTERTKLATVSGNGQSIRWDVAGPYSAATLTVVAPDGRSYRREFKARVTPEMTLSDLPSRVTDGVYSYELRLAPVISKEAREALSSARGKDDDAEAVRAARTPVPTGLVQSGSFAVINGTIVSEGALQESTGKPISKSQQPHPRQSSPTSQALTSLRRHHRASVALAMPDQVIPDDLIVQGSGCFGFDCVNNENFGFDTLRLKENSTRLQFEDTSTSVGFPTNNWQIRANDSGSGGASYLAIVDQGPDGNSEVGTVVFQVDAAAPANSLRVSSTGNIGLGTATPALDLHANTSDTPAFRFEQNNSGGFTAQTWDIAGNEANFFVRDVTGGSRLPFRIRPGAPTSSLDISATGLVGIGTASPNSRLDVKQHEDTFLGGVHLRRAVSNDTWSLATGTDNNMYVGYANDASLANAASDFSVFPLILTTNNRVGIGMTLPDQTLTVNGNASKPGGGSWAAFSDERLKTVKGQFTRGLQTVMQLQPLRYEYRRDNALGLKSEGEHVGFGAQELQKVLPEAVIKNEAGYLLVNNDPIIWTMLNAIKEQQKQIEELKKEVQQLRDASRPAQ